VDEVRRVHSGQNPTSFISNNRSISLEFKFTEHEVETIQFFPIKYL